MRTKLCRAAAAIVACVALLSGCGSGVTSVSGQEATPGVKNSRPAKTSAPPSAAADPETPAPSAGSTPSSSATPPPTYRFPMQVSGLFGASPAPDGFSSLVWLSGAGSFLYATRQGCVCRAAWDGSSYVSSPVAEQVSAGYPVCTYVDELRGELFCQGVRPNTDGGTDPCVVMVKLADGSRCNVDDYVGWKEEGFDLSTAFQCSGGLLLARMTQSGGKHPTALRWAVVDVGKRTYTVLDFSDFREKNLPQWQDITQMSLSLAGKNRLLALFTGHGVQTGASTSASAAETSGKSASCWAFLLDLDGNVLSSGAVTLAPDNVTGAAALMSGLCVSASPDGKYLLYGSSKAQGVYLFDTDSLTETEISGSAGAKTAFAQWGVDGAVYYGLDWGSSDKGMLLYRLSAQEALGAGE